MLHEKLSTARQFAEVYRRTELFVAPEVLRNPNAVTLKSDLFSVGMLIFEASNQTALAQEKKSVHLRQLWSDPSTAGLSKILEDLIDDKPEKRGLLLGRGETKDFYGDLIHDLGTQYLIYANVYKSGKYKTDRWQLIFMASYVDVLKNVFELFKFTKSIGGGKKKLYQKLLFWSGINYLCLSVIIFVFSILTVYDIQIFLYGEDGGWLPGNFVIYYERYIPHDFVFGDFFGNIWGRVVAFSFGVIAARYYANIFSTISYPSYNDSRDLITNMSIRINSFCYILPILFALMYSPKLWPYCSVIGTTFVLLNNYICY